MDANGISETLTLPYTSWFGLTITGNSHPSCALEKHYLGGCNTPGYENIEYNNPVTHRITMTSTIPPTENQITI